GTYTWSTGSTNNPLVVTTSGTYTVTYKSADNCTAPVSASTTVTVNPIPPQPTVTAGGPLTFCDGGSVSLTAATVGFTGGTYTWSNGSTTNPLVVTTSGSYSVTYTSPANCTAPVSTSTTVTVNPIPPQPTVTASGPLTFCDGGSVSLTAATAGFTGGTYTWSTGSTNNPLVVTTSGTYTVTYKSADNCTAPVSASTTVTVNPIPPQPVVTAAGNTNICPGETVTMSASAAGYSGTFEWFKGTQSLGISNSIDLTIPDSYSVLFKTDEGCVSSIAETFSITARPFNSAVDLGADLVVCNNYVELLTTSPLFGKGSWSLYDPGLQFDTKADSSYVRISGLVDGKEYKFVYKVSGECGDDRTDTIKVRAGVPGFKIASLQTPNDTMCVGVARTVEVNVTGGSGKYVYHWLNAATNDTMNTTVNSLNITPASVLTTYYVYVEDKVKTGCKTFADTILISALEKQKLLVPNLITPNKDGMNDEFKIVEVDNYNNKMFPSGSYVEVYNRWGTRVYQANNYDGTWKGENTEDGMYFYYVKTGCGGEEFKGWLQILGNVN
ncbi:MAG: gliding motility-associated C-terminal domain-containing protein, partial [Cytophaga sp.]|uniref:gliding motility-associated C-terminal domain-containing protein n=1 Tax=Cytophaga sp. TaxID=29535 RepID=UPI003F81E226